MSSGAVQWKINSSLDYSKGIGYTHLSHHASGSVIELLHESVGYFVFKERFEGEPRKCYLREYRLVRDNFTYPNALKFSEAGEGDPFPHPNENSVFGEKDVPHVFDSTVQIPSWQLIIFRGQILIRGLWGTELWLLGNGFLVYSKISAKGLLMTNGETVDVSIQEAFHILEDHKVSTHFEDLIEATTIQPTFSTPKLPKVSKQQSLLNQIQAHRNVLPSLNVSQLRRRPSACKSASPRRKKENEYQDIINVLANFTSENILTTEQFEMCKQNAKSLNFNSLKRNVLRESSSALDREVHTREGRLLDRKEEVEAIRRAFDMKVTWVERARQETLKEPLERRSLLVEQQSALREEAEFARMESEFEEDDNPVEDEAIYELQAEIDDIDVVIEELKDQTAEEIRLIRNEESIEIKKWERIIASEEAKLRQLKESVAEVKRCQTAESIPEKKRRWLRRLHESRKILNKPDLIRQHRSLIDTIHAAATEVPASPMHDKWVKSLAMEEGWLMLSNTRCVSDIPGDDKIRRNFVSQEHMHSMEYVRPKTGGMCPEENDESQAFLKKRLVAIGHTNMIRSIRSKDLGTHRSVELSRAAQVDFEIHMRTLEDVPGESRARFEIDGVRYLTSRGDPASTAILARPRDGMSSHQSQQTTQQRPREDPDNLRLLTSSHANMLLSSSMPNPLRPSKLRDFDLTKAKREAVAFVSSELPGVQRPFTHESHWSEELWDALSKLPSPRRRPLLHFVNVMDVVLPHMSSELSALRVQCAYRRHTSRILLQTRRERRFYSAVLMIQCNVRVFLARRTVPRRQAHVAELERQAKALQAKNAHRQRVLSLAPEAVAGLSEEDKVAWITSRVVISEDLARRMLVVTEGDASKVCRLVAWSDGSRAGTPAPPPGRSSSKLQPTKL